MDPEVAKKHRNPPEYWEYNFRDAIIYALGIGCKAKTDLRYVYEGHEQFMPLPTYVVAPGLNASGLMGWPGVEFDLARILHGEQYIETFKPFPNETKLRSESRVIDILDKNTGALIISEITTYDDHTNEKLAVQQIGTFQIGAGGFGGNKSHPEAVEVAKIPERAPDGVVEERVGSDQVILLLFQNNNCLFYATLYRMGSLDLNPLHVDPTFAQMSGFKQPINHGLCTLGFAFRHLLGQWADNDAERFKAIKVRFSSPVLPGQTLRTESWKEKDLIHFQVKVKETGKVVISNGWIKFSQTSDKPTYLENLTAKI